MSFAITSVELGGLLTLTKKGVTFQAQAIRLVWQDTTLYPETTTLGQFFLSKRQLDKLKINGKSLAEFLAERPFYHYPIQVNDAYPQTLAEALYIQHLLDTGQWKSLPLQRDLLTITPNMLIRRLINMQEAY